MLINTKGLIIAIVVFAPLYCLANAIDQTDHLLGTWENNVAGNKMRLSLQADGLCEISVERVLKPVKKKACKYEPFNNRYLIFLIKENGLCGDDASFEFSYDAAAPLIEFYIGSQTLLMNKVEQQ